MSKANGRVRRQREDVGFGKPPKRSQFRPGKSGNPKGRPKGAKNFETELATELEGKVAVSENGRHKKITKRNAIVKQLVNKAASGDLKATQTVMNETRERETGDVHQAALGIFDTREHRLVMTDIVRRIRLMDEPIVPQFGGEAASD